MRQSNTDFKVDIGQISDTDDRLLVPFPRAYWVVPGRFLAGEYPGAKHPAEALEKLDALLKAGIRSVINLMQPHERDFKGQPLVPYAETLEKLAAGKKLSMSCSRIPIPDFDVTSEVVMTHILDTIDFNLRQGLPTYVHCLGGIGRTGTVVGCYLMRHKMADKESVLTGIQLLRQNTADAHRASPETKAQREMIWNWSRR